MRLIRFFLLSASMLILFQVSLASSRPRTAGYPAKTQQDTVSGAAPHQRSTILADFAWLAGRWEGQLGNFTAEQEWMAPKNGTMQGSFRLTDDRRTILIELFTLRETPDGIFLYFRHFSPELLPQEKDQAYRLKLVKWDASRFQFDNTVQNELKDAIFTRLDTDHFTSHGDITGDDGKPAVIEVPYHRVK